MADHENSGAGALGSRGDFPGMPRTADVPSVDELSLFVLAYNEAPNIEHTVLDCLATLPRLARRYELLIIDDGSTDRTNAIASELADAHEHVRLVTHPQNRGWGNTQKTGFENSRYELVTYVPGDYQVRIDAVERMLPHIENADIVIGTRRERRDYAARVRAAEFYNFTLRTMFGLKVRDIDSIKIVRKRVLDDIRIQSNSANVDVELIVRAHRRGYRIVEVDVPHYARTAGEQSGVSPRVMQRQLRELVPFWFRNIR